MRIFVLATTESEPEVFVDEPTAVEQLHEALLALGFDGDVNNPEEINDFNREIENGEAHLFALEVPIPLSRETVQTLADLDSRFSAYSAPNFASVRKALAEVKQILS